MLRELTQNKTEFIFLDRKYLPPGKEKGKGRKGREEGKGQTDRRMTVETCVLTKSLGGSPVSFSWGTQEADSNMTPLNSGLSRSACRRERAGTLWRPYLQSQGSGFYFKQVIVRCGVLGWPMQLFTDHLYTLSTRLEYWSIVRSWRKSQIPIRRTGYWVIQNSRYHFSNEHDSGVVSKANTLKIV